MGGCRGEPQKERAAMGGEAGRDGVEGSGNAPESSVMEGFCEQGTGDKDADGEGELCDLVEDLVDAGSA